MLEKRLVEVELELVRILVVELVNVESKLEMIDVVDELVSEVNRDDGELVDDDVGDADDEDKYVVFKDVDWLVSVVEYELVDELGDVDDKLDANESVKYVIRAEVVDEDMDVKGPKDDE